MVSSALILSLPNASCFVASRDGAEQGGAGKRWAHIVTAGSRPVQLWRRVQAARRDARGRAGKDLWSSNHEKRSLGRTP